MIVSSLYNHQLHFYSDEMYWKLYIYPYTLY